MRHDGTGFERLLAWRQKHNLPRRVASVPMDVRHADPPTITIGVRFVALFVKVLPKLFGDRSDVFVGVHAPDLQSAGCDRNLRAMPDPCKESIHLGCECDAATGGTPPTAASRIGVAAADAATDCGLTCPARVAAFISAIGKALARSAAPTSEGCARWQPLSINGMEAADAMRRSARIKRQRL